MKKELNIDKLKGVAWERAKNQHNNSVNPYEQNWDKLRKEQRVALMEIELGLLLAIHEFEYGEEYEGA